MGRAGAAAALSCASRDRRAGPRVVGWETLPKAVFGEAPKTAVAAPALPGLNARRFIRYRARRPPASRADARRFSGSSRRAAGALHSTSRRARRGRFLPALGLVR